MGIDIGDAFQGLIPVAGVNHVVIMLYILSAHVTPAITISMGSCICFSAISAIPLANY